MSTKINTIRKALATKYGARKYRITAEGDVHVHGVMPNSNSIGWYLLGPVDDHEVLAQMEIAGGAKSDAVLISAGRVVARAHTAASNGETVSYGFETDGHAIHQVGQAKVSRAKRYLQDQELMLALEERQALVNYGGGAPI